MKFDRQEKTLLNLGLVLAIIVGAFLRLHSVLNSSFPLGDGGLFYTMAHDLQAANFKLPFYTTYNTGQIPFVYPPLGIYLASSLSFIFKFSLLDIFRIVPP